MDEPQACLSKAEVPARKQRRDPVEFGEDTLRKPRDRPERMTTLLSGHSCRGSESTWSKASSAFTSISGFTPTWSKRCSSAL